MRKKTMRMFRVSVNISGDEDWIVLAEDRASARENFAEWDQEELVGNLEIDVHVTEIDRLPKGQKEPDGIIVEDGYVKVSGILASETWHPKAKCWLNEDGEEVWPTFEPGWTGKENPEPTVAELEAAGQLRLPGIVKEG